MSMDKETIFHVTAADQGGAVYPSQTCPHLFTAVDSNALSFLDNIVRNDTGWKECSCSECDSFENWVCLKCGSIGCSRYANCHSEIHFMTTLCGLATDYHCLALSMSDLSIWCYRC
jgi:histone deacetylase 6